MTDPFQEMRQLQQKAEDEGVDVFDILAMEQEDTKAPNPGSDEAVEKGCTCPVLDNGRGDEKLGNTRGFWITENCPLHTENPFIDENGQPYHDLPERDYE